MNTARGAVALLAGLMFGLGLAISQMSNPVKVLSFLSLGPGWDPSLLLVMAGAVAVSLIGFRVFRGPRPVLDDQFHDPDARRIDTRLIVGAALFGLGWGLAGYCPGPALAGLASGSVEPLVFVVSMLVGGQLARRVTP